MPLFRAAHRLAGAGATFGFLEVGEEARRLADEVLTYLEGERSKSNDCAARIAPMVAAVGSSVRPEIRPGTS
jgi:chemotaxis protein histidine kinase CheA